MISDVLSSYSQKGKIDMLTIAEIKDRKDLQLCQDPIQVDAIQQLIGAAAYPFNGFFVKSDDGGYLEIFGFEGFVQNPQKMVTQVL